MSRSVSGSVAAARALSSAKLALSASGSYATSSSAIADSACFPKAIHAIMLAGSACFPDSLRVATDESIFATPSSYASTLPKPIMARKSETSLPGFLLVASVIP